MPRSPLPLLLVLLTACSDNAAGWDAALPDTRGPDGYAYRLDTGFGPGDGLGPGPDGSDLAGPDLRPDGGGALVSLDFESNNGGLTGTKDWEWGTASSTKGSNCDGSAPTAPSSGHSGTKMWGTKLNDCYSPNESSDSNCKANTSYTPSILTLSVSIPSSWSSAYLHYWQWFDVGSDFDWREVRIDGTVATDTSTFTGCKGQVSLKWEKQTIDLSSHTGKTISITFRFYATGVVQAAGWFIDDLSVSSSSS